MTMKFLCLFAAVFLLLITTVLCDETGSMKWRKGTEGKNIICLTVKCEQMTFIPCTKNMTHDVCVNCTAGYFMPDTVETKRWDAGELECEKIDCSCDPEENILSNPKTCGVTQKKKCECDRTKGWYDEHNHIGQVTACQHTNVKCNREGIQLGINGKCEKCPVGTEKKKNDSSLCVRISPGTRINGPYGTNTPGSGSETTTFADTTVMPNTTISTQNTPVEEQSAFLIYVPVIVGVAVALVTASCILLYLQRHRKLDAIKRQLSRRLCRDDAERGGNGSPQTDDSSVPLVSGDIKNCGKEDDKFPNAYKANNENQAESYSDKGVKQKVAKIAPYHDTESDDTMEESTVRTGDNGVKSTENSAEPVFDDSTNVKQVVPSEQTPVKGIVPSQQTVPKTVTFSDQTNLKQLVLEHGSEIGRMREIQQTPVD